MDYQTIPFNVTTMTISSKTGLIFNLCNIGKYMKLNEQIISVRYMFGDVLVQRGAIDPGKVAKRLFYNQLSIVVKKSVGHVNVKLFNNGTVHMTGCKSESEFTNILHMLLHHITHTTPRSDIIGISLDENDVYVDSDNMIYNDSEQIVGFKTCSLYIFGNIKCIYDYEKKIFVSLKTFSSRTQKLFDCNGSYCGIKQIELIKGKKRLFNQKNLVIDSDTIYHNNVVLGFVHWNFKKDKEKNRVSFKELSYNVKCIETDMGNHLDIHLDVHSINVSLKISAVNVNKMFKWCCSKNKICSFNPNKYPGLKLHFEHVTVILFNSGNVLMFGMKSKTDILETCRQLFSDHKQFIEYFNFNKTNSI